MWNIRATTTQQTTIILSLPVFDVAQADWWSKAIAWYDKHCFLGTVRASVPLLDVLCGDSMTILKHLIPGRSSTQIRKTGQIPVVMATSSVLVTLPSLWQALPLQRQVKWKTANSHSLPVSHYIWTLLPLLYLSSISHLSHYTHLKQRNLHVCLLVPQRYPNASSEKLFIVHRQLPPGVLVSQKALQMQWEIPIMPLIIHYIGSTFLFHIF